MGQWQSQPTCTTPACVHAASLVLQNLAPDWQQMDPCVDFDKMVCYGTFEHDGVDGGTMTDMRKRNNNILRKIMESPNAAGYKSTLLTARSNTEEHNFDMLRTTYQTCMDTDAILAAGMKPLEDLIVTINKTWPVSPSDLKTKVGSADFDGLHQATLIVEKLGSPVFHGQCSKDLAVLPDFLSPKKNRICWSAPKPFFRSNFSKYSDPAAMEKYSNLRSNIFRLTYPNIDDKTASALADEVTDLEVDLAKLIMSYPDSTSETPRMGETRNVSVAEIGKLAPALAFDKLIAGLTPAGKTPPVIHLNYPALFPQLSNIVTNHSRAAVQGFLLWKTIGHLGGEVGDPQLLSALGLTETTPRWEKCIAFADVQLRHILNSYYVKATYSELAMRAADKMTTNIRTSFKKRISELGWMSQESKQRATKKVDNIVQNIGYPTKKPDLRSAESLASYYTGLNVSANHFANVLAGQRHATAMDYAEVANEPNRNIMLDISAVNAFYSRIHNFITIPAGISQLPIFHYHLPNYALYGALGAVIGHEITHGFDNNGREWNENHEFKPWWDNSTVSNFKSRQSCFVDQFSNFEVDTATGKANVNGTLTLGENISDAGGLRAAYHAWAEERKAMPSAWDQSLPGLDGFTHEQLFFVFWANIWCTSEAADVTDVHAPEAMRIRGTTQNSREFREAFKCKAKEPTCELF